MIIAALTIPVEKNKREKEKLPTPHEIEYLLDKLLITVNFLDFVKGKNKFV